jgi:serine-type D-Ala-D-Ala carboxypeptidase (penicillin-binding protein 5/6)
MRSGRTMAVAAVSIAVIVAVLVARLAGEQAPPLTAHRTLAAYLRLAGSPPRIAWPREGQSAVEIEGVGSFGSSGGSAPVPIASVAKVMTAYLTTTDFPLKPGASGFDLRITPAEVAEERSRVAEGQSTVAVRRGEILNERQALQAMMLPSGNNIAALLAARDAGGVPAFLTRMNRAARALGMRSTTYTDPSGFDASTTSTAGDQLKLARAAMAIPALAEIVGEARAQVPVAGQVSNLNALVGQEGFTGVKTGSDRAAGGCLLFTRQVVVGGRRLTVVGAVLGQRRGGWIESALASARTLGNSAAGAVRLQTALPAGSPVMVLSSADGGQTTAVTTRSLRRIGWAGLRIPVGLSAVPSLRLVRRGQRLLAVTLGGVHSTGGASAPAIADGALGGPSLGWRLSHIL